MARDSLSRRFSRREELIKSRDLTSRYLDHTRTRRLPRSPAGPFGPKFFLLVAASILVVATIVLADEAFSAITAYTMDLPPVSDLSLGLAFKTTQILDRHGNLLYEIDDKNGGRRFPVYLKDVSPNLIDATIATEDKNFYSDPGVDPFGIVRAALQDMVQGQLVQGASTITEQLAKNVLIDRQERTQKSYVRKIQEAVLAFRITRAFSKDDILQMYLNQVYYGHLSYGIEAAAETYFGKHARDLDVAQAAMLAGLPQAPSAYDPLIHLDAAKARQAHVLDRMVQQGYITQQQADQAKAEKLDLRTGVEEPFQAPHFVMYVKQLLEQKYGADVVYNEGLRVTTTLDLGMNRVAEQAIRAHMENLKLQDANDAGLVAMDPKTGEILAMVGSPDYNDNSIAGEVNMATSPRQPGSTIKPIEYAVAFMKGWGPETIITDEPTAFPNTQPYLPPYEPHNFDNKFDGPMTIRYALANSKNIPAVKTLMFDTIPTFLQVAGQLGIQFENPDRYGLSLGLGAGSVSLLNMVDAYAALDNYGIYHPPVAILKVEDWQGNVLEQYQPTAGRQVIGPVQAYMVTSILADNWARTPLQGPASPLLLSRPDAAKTGSTDDYKDSWTIGYTPDLAAGVWVGNSDDRPMKEVLGSLGAGRIWHSFMEDVHLGTPVQQFTPPPGIRQYTICQDTGQPATADCKNTLTEVWPTSYTPAQYAVIPGLPTNGSPAFAGVPVRQGRALGQTVSATGQDLQPIPNGGNRAAAAGG
jgi:1A family penicillin-binding protein